MELICYSRLPVYLKHSSNNCADNVFGYFVEAVQTYGLPLRIHTDLGGENTDIAKYIWFQPDRGPDRNSAIMGQSVHNQQIECLWHDISFRGAPVYSTGFFIFSKM